MNRLPAPETLRAQLPAPDVTTHLDTVRDVIAGRDDRLLVVVGPCSAHDPVAMLEYAGALATAARDHRRELVVVLRVYPEKPRSRHGWPGMLLDPQRDAGYALAQGIEASRRLMVDVAALGLPVATEFVEPMVTPYLSDLVSWAAIGARCVESPPHRRLASDLPMPVGVKNRIDGAVGPAVDAVAVATAPQPVVRLDDQGRPGWHVSAGNRHTHLVLRGGAAANYHAHQVEHALHLLSAVVDRPRLVVDCSHGNSGKDHRRQPVAVGAVAEQIAAGQTGIAGVMMESFLHEGSQPITPPLRYGVSVTDSCLGLDRTLDLLVELAAATRQRRDRTTTVPVVSR